MRWSSPPDRVGDAHVVVVDHHREHVGGRAVGAQQHHVVEGTVVDIDITLYQIRYDRPPRLRCPKADDRVDAGRRLRLIAVAPATVVKRGPACGACLGAHGLQLLRRAIAPVGRAGGEEVVRARSVAFPPRELVHDFAVPIEAEPSQPVDDRSQRLWRRSLAVGVLQPQPEGAAVMAGVEPVEEGGPRAAEVQHAGRRRCEARDDAHVRSHPRRIPLRSATDRNGRAFSISPDCRRPAAAGAAASKPPAPAFKSAQGRVRAPRR